MEAKCLARRSAGGLEDYFGAIFLAERAGGIGVGIGGEKSCEFGWSGIDCVPPVAVGIEDDCAGAEDLLDAVRIFSCDVDDHVDEFCGAEGLADERADADELGVVFGVFDGDLGGEWHGDSLGKSGRCGKRGGDEWRGEWGGRLGRVLDMPLLRFISLAGRFDDRSVIRI